MSTPQNQNQSKFVNVKLEVVKEIETRSGGLVIVYLASSNTILNEFYLVTFDDKLAEVAWGMGDTLELALKDAERQWNDLEDELNPDIDNPFTEAIQKISEKTEEFTTEG